MATKSAMTAAATDVTTRAVGVGSSPRAILEDRARRVLDSIVDQESLADVDQPLTDFHTELRRTVGDPGDGGVALAMTAGRWATQSAVSDLPLLSEPHHARPSDRSAREHQSHIGYPSGRAWLFVQAYEVGEFGAVLYQRRGGDPNWLVSPYVATDAVQDGESYAAVWERAFGTERLIACILDRTGDTHSPDGPLECPLCALSTDSCDDDDCVVADQVTAVQSRVPSLVDAIEFVRS